MAYAELLDEAARVNGTGTALVSGATRNTWKEIRFAAARIAAGLADRQGLKPGDRAAVLMSLSRDNALLAFALSWLGTTIVPLNTRLNHEDMLDILKLADVRALFWDPASASRATALAGTLGISAGAAIDQTVLDDLSEALPCRAPSSRTRISQP